MRNALRIEVAERFGEFLAAQGFDECFYEYNEEMFGNEILDFTDGNFCYSFHPRPLSDHDQPEA